MKYLLLLVLSFNVFAEYKVVITPDNSKHGKLLMEAQSQDEAKEKLIKWVDRQKVYKSEWGSYQPNGISKQLYDLEGNPLKTVYLKPLDYSFEIVDITEEVKAQKDKEEKIKNLKTNLKDKDLNLKEINELLREIL